DTFLFDCDGVLYAGDELLPGAAAAVSSLKKRGKRVLFVTNNSAKSRAGMAAQLSRLGLENVEAEDMLPSSFISARYLAKRGAQKAFVIGAAGLVEELRLAGVEVVQTGGGAKLSAEAFASFALETGVGAVVVGHDSAANFRDVAVASLYLDEDPDCLFVSTNHDAFDVVRGRKYPGNGVFVAALAVAAGRQPDATCGKPSTDLVEYIRETFLRHGEAACVVGDRLDTDMALASKLGASGLLVLTGCATAQ
ncbi:HAD-like domain-containing protein, partial [Pelagophyceae sp. CCMP2097]